MNKRKVHLCILCFLLLVLIMMVGCSSKTKPEDNIEKPLSFEQRKETLNGQPMGVVTGTLFDTLTLENFPASERLYYNSTADCVLALQNGKIAGFLADEPVAKVLIANDASYEILPGLIMEDQYGYAFPLTEEGERLQGEINEFLETLKSTGEMDEIIEAWIAAESKSKVLEDASNFPVTQGVIRVGTDGALSPFLYPQNDQYVGIDADILTRFCKDKGYALEYSTMSFDALIPSLLAGRIDLAADCLSITEERKKSVLFSDPTYSGGVVVVVEQPGEPRVIEKEDFASAFKASFQKNFMQEQRWKAILKGMGVTLIISVFSLLFGTIAGFGICLMHRAGNRWMSGIARVYIQILQGTPIVVLLMVLYYIVLNKTGLNGIVVSIIAFSMNYAAYAAEIFRSGIESVKRGQSEAAIALGFTETQTFWKIVFPQAAQRFLPLLQGEFISLVKTTSVVGYVAVQDLTKVSDIIRSRTYEAFFPLIVTAFIYFLLAWILTLSLHVLDKKLIPRRKNTYDA